MEPITQFLSRIKRIIGDHYRTSALLSAKIIADVIVDDTVCIKDPTAHIAFDEVLVNSTILDEIKGKQVPLCVSKEMQGRHKNGATVKTSGTVPWAARAVPADSGTCLQFEYAPAWFNVYYPDEDMGPRIGWSIKPHKEYIVFLGIGSVGADSTSQYFTVGPESIGTQLGMYPVVDCIVQDPNDDFHLGSSHLLVSEWKSRLRARIKEITNPKMSLQKLLGTPK
jgi:hypothetical protein